MSRRRSARVNMAPMAVASDGSVIVNAGYMLDTGDPLEIIEKLGASAELYIGIVVPPRHVPEVMRKLDDGVAEIAGMIGPTLTAAAGGSASSPSSAGPRRGGRDRAEGRVRRRRGRQP